jgi:asparagine synthase (glutamine-hydrolysing)
MAAALVHRGPDARGFFVDLGVGLASRRLCIIDLKGGKQPIANEDGTVRVVLNGEIYNFQELRHELENHGHRFYTQADTEVIAHGYEQWGANCLHHFNGMFAFALWDGKARALLLARDRIGKKPLFYRVTDEGLSFASEMKALLQSKDLGRTVDPEALDLYFTFGAVPPPKTIFREVAQLPPAHYALYRDGMLAVGEYWDAVPVRAPGMRSEEAWLEEFRWLLDDSVKRRLISDVPLGAFLSGGIDSTTVVESMVRQLRERVWTVTVGFREQAYTESKYARSVAQALGTDHREMLAEPETRDLLPKLIWHLDEPMADSSALPTYLVCRAARQHVTVALSGDGGDELFGGYEGRYRLEHLESRIRAWLPDWVRQGVAAPLARIYPKREWIPKPLRLKYSLENLSVLLPEAYVLDRSIFRPKEKASVLNPDIRERLREDLGLDTVRPYFKRAGATDPLSQILYADLKTNMVNTILTKVDRMSMANSLEVRCPLLDFRLVEFAARVPISWKMRGRTSKYLLRRHLEGRVAREHVDRHKQGFSFPLAEWLRGEWKPLVQDVLLSQQARARGYLDARQVERLLSQHVRGERDYSTQLWALLVLEQWQRLFADGDSSPGVKEDEPEPAARSACGI